MRLLIHTLIIAVVTNANISIASASDWYQIEMIVFAHNDEASETEEAWPEDVALSYPARVKMLFDAIQLPSEVNEDPAIDLSIGFPEFTQTLSLETPSSENQFEFSAQDDSPLLPSESQNIEEEFVDKPQPLAFQRLESDAKALKDAYQHLRRIDRYRPLFHEVWQQPLQSRRQSPAILVTGGEQYGSHYELEGTVNIAVERYLHIDTDLWLHNFLPNFGQQSTYQVPELPTNRQSDFLNEDVYSPFSLIIDEPYRVSRTVTLRQSRRMRSGEIHYFDHPLMGVIVLVTPLERD